jgi:hypothetical protein
VHHGTKLQDQLHRLARICRLEAPGVQIGIIHCGGRDLVAVLTGKV